MGIGNTRCGLRSCLNQLKKKKIRSEKYTTRGRVLRMSLEAHRLRKDTFLYSGGTAADTSVCFCQKAAEWKGGWFGRMLSFSILWALCGRLTLQNPWCPWNGYQWCSGWFWSLGADLPSHYNIIFTSSDKHRVNRRISVLISNVSSRSALGQHAALQSIKKPQCLEHNGRRPGVSR